jgi:glycosyltransferase involved in cell wall biosynthesis
MKLPEAKAKAIELAAKGERWTVIYADAKQGIFNVVPTDKCNAFPHFHNDAYLPSKEVTFCIANYKDEKRLDATLKSLFASVDRSKVSVIVSVDGAAGQGRNPYRAVYPEVSYIYTDERRGVGYVLDRAVEAARTEIVFIMGADIVFPESDWMPSFLDKVKSEHQGLICTRCGKLSDINAKLTPETHSYTGATMVFRHPSGKIPQRTMLEAKWTKTTGTGLQKVDCVLGAFYGCHRSWYLYIKGFAGHREWGTLEPLISLRNLVMGGKNLIDMDTVIGHLFVQEGHGTPKDIRSLVFNKLLLADGLLPQDMRDEVFAWARKQHLGPIAIKYYQDDKEAQEISAEFRKAAEAKRNAGRVRKSFEDLRQDGKG